MAQEKRLVTIVMGLVKVVLVSVLLVMEGVTVHVQVVTVLALNNLIKLKSFRNMY
jgi:hypothetical protein